MESKVDLLTREQKFRLLDQLVSNGIEELCRFAKQHKFLEPPYGKRPDPTPLITEEDFVGAGALQCDDKEPEFQYEYGFDPVKFLGQYLVWAHPDSVETRRLKKVDALSRLRFRVAHARRQLHTEQILRERAQNFSSGVAWGPLALLVTATSVRLSLRTFRAATVLVQVAADAAFSDDVRYLRLAAAETQPGVFLAKADLDRLRSKQLYHVRAYAAGEGDAAALPADADFWLATEADALCRLALYASFSTAPVETDAGDGAAQAADDGDEDEPRPKTQRPASRSASRDVDDATELAAMREKVMTLRCVGQLPLEAALFAPPALPAPQLSRGLQPPPATEAAGADDDASVASFADSRARAFKAERPPDATALLGDVFWHRDADLFEAPLPPEQYAAQLSALLQRLFYALATAPPAAAPDAPASTTLLLAYRDAHPRAMAALRQEELAFKQHRHDVKKFNKKHDLADDGKARGARGKAAKAAAPGAKAAETKDLPPPPPQLRLPELSPALQVLLQQLPVPLSMQPPPAAPPKDEKPKPPKRPGAPPAAPPAPVPEPPPLAPRMLYRAVPLCADVLVIALDLRRTPPHLTTQAPFFAPACDYLGREQADWLARILRKSTALWKVILCAKTFGAARVREVVATQTTQSSLQFGGGGGGDDGRPGTASPPPLLSRPLTADGAAVDGAAPTVPGAGGLKRQASANASSQTRFVQVLEPEKDESRSLDAVYDDVDDAFRRPKCSLQYVLARYQERLAEEAAKELGGAPPPQVLPPPLRPETDGAGRVEQLYVSSGVVLVTGGVASAFTRHVTTTLRAPSSSAASRPASPEAAVSNSSSAQTLLSTASGAAVSVTLADVGETPAPGFCATYASLTAVATQAAGSPLDARAPPQALPFCAEVSLGRAAPGGFAFLQGFDARAAFVHDAPGDARDAVAAPQCELSLLADGRLEVACFEALPLQTQAAGAGAVDAAGRRALFTCRLTVPSLDGDDAASSQSADSVHVA